MASAADGIVRAIGEPVEGAGAPAARGIVSQVNLAAPAR